MAVAAVRQVRRVRYAFISGANIGAHLVYRISKHSITLKFCTPPLDILLLRANKPAVELHRIRDLHEELTPRNGNRDMWDMPAKFQARSSNAHAPFVS